MENIVWNFLGTGWNFPPTFRKELGGVDMISGVEDIESSLYILLSTRPGERVMQPLYGCNLHSFCFQPLNTETETMIEKIVHDAVNLFEPRIIVNAISVVFAREEGEVKINVDYTIIKTNTRTNYVYPFYKTEGTNLER